MADEQDRLQQQKRRGRGRAGPGGLLQKKDNIFKGLDEKDVIIVIDGKNYKLDGKNYKLQDLSPRVMITDPEKKAKGGRAGLKGGGICKRGMNRKAVGKNS